MGLDVVRFRGGAVDEELICPICTGVLEAPLQAPVSKTLLQNNIFLRQGMIYRNVSLLSVIW